MSISQLLFTADLVQASLHVQYVVGVGSKTNGLWPPRSLHQTDMCKEITQINDVGKKQAGRVWREKDACQGTSLVFRSERVRYRYTGSWEGSESEVSKCKGPGVEMASTCSKTVETWWSCARRGHCEVER